MSTQSKTILVSIFAIAVTATMAAAQQAPAPPPTIPYGAPIAFEAAKKVMAAAEAEALKNNWSMAIAILDSTGHIVMLHRFDNTQYGSIAVAEDKAPIVIDAEMTAGGLHRFHAVVQVRKATPQQEGLQRNAIFAAFGALKDLDLVIVVDDDIDIRDPHDVEYALATRMEASRDLVVMPAARGHEYIRVGQNGIRAKLGIDATVPVGEKARFARCQFEQVAVDANALSADAALIRARLDL
jgi:2,5-furandicarboxylate decarboxylase 1